MSASLSCSFYGRHRTGEAYDFWRAGLYARPDRATGTLCPRQAHFWPFVNLAHGRYNAGSPVARDTLVLEARFDPLVMAGWRSIS